MFGLWGKKSEPTQSASYAQPASETDPIVDESAVIYKVGSLSDIVRVMNREAQGTGSPGSHRWEFEMKGVGLSPTPITQFDGERKILSVHTHPLEPELKDDPVVQFLKKTYGLSFEESSLLLSMSDICHTLEIFATGNSIADRTGLSNFNTFEATAGTVLLDENRKIVLSGLLPISRIPKKDYAQLREAASAGLDEQTYKGMTPETMKKFYDVLVGFTVTSDTDASFLFGEEGVSHVIGARFAFGIMDKGITTLLREAGELDGSPTLAIGLDSAGALMVVLESSVKTPQGSVVNRAMALPAREIEPNQRIVDVLGTKILGVNHRIDGDAWKEELTRFLKANHSHLRPIEIGSEVLRVFPVRFNPDGGKSDISMRVGAVGTKHSVHMSEQLIAYVMSRNTMRMQNAVD